MNPSRCVVVMSDLGQRLHPETQFPHLQDKANIPDGYEGSGVIMPLRRGSADVIERMVI